MKEKILSALKNVIDPDLGKDIVSLNMVQDIDVRENTVFFTFVLTTPACPMKDRFIEDCTKAIQQYVDPNLKVKISWDSKVTAQKKENETKMAGIKNLIAIASGKGGVGKSTVAVNTAISLAHFGAKVGILDADINGPSLPVMLGIDQERPKMKAEAQKQYMIPIENYGIKIMSIGSLVPEDKPVVWRGPMLSNGLTQLLTDTAWEELDYLIIDLPPGTGDIHMTLCQQMPLTAAVIVTTPQRVSVTDTLKTIEMFRIKQMDIPVVGIVENMSYFTPRELPDNKYYIFGKGGADVLSKKYNIPILGRLPLVMGVADNSDQGVPAVIMDGNEIQKEEFSNIAQKLAQELSILNLK